jgi:hypothetical protein
MSTEKRASHIRSSGSVFRCGRSRDADLSFLLPSAAGPEPPGATARSSADAPSLYADQTPISLALELSPASTTPSESQTRIIPNHALENRLFREIVEDAIGALNGPLGTSGARLQGARPVPSWGEHKGRSLSALGLRNTPLLLHSNHFLLHAFSHLFGGDVFFVGCHRP